MPDKGPRRSNVGLQGLTLESEPCLGYGFESVTFSAEVFHDFTCGLVEFTFRDEALLSSTDMAASGFWNADSASVSFAVAGTANTTQEL